MLALGQAMAMCVDSLSLYVRQRDVKKVVVSIGEGGDKKSVGFQRLVSSRDPAFPPLPRKQSWRSTDYSALRTTGEGSGVTLAGQTSRCSSLRRIGVWVPWKAIHR